MRVIGTLSRIVSNSLKSQSGNTSPKWFFGCHTTSNWNLEMLVFEERGKLENSENKLPEQEENQQHTQPTCGVV